jgi:hypothetical protein
MISDVSRAGKPKMPKKKMFFICCVIGDENDKSLLNFPTGKV